MNRQTAVHPHNGLLLLSNRKGCLRPATTWVNLQENTPRKRSKAQKLTYYDTIYMTFLKRQNYRDGEQISSYPGAVSKGE